MNEPLAARAGESPAARESDALRPRLPGKAPESAWLAIHLPYLPLEALGERSGAGSPAAVVGERDRLVVCNRAAQAEGIAGGMSLAAAYALRADLRVRKRDEPLETAALEGLAAWCLQFTPEVSLEPPCTALLEIGGSARLFGGLDRLAAEVRIGVRALGYRAGIAVGATPLAACLLARAGRERRAGEASSPAEALGRVPLAHLMLEDEVLASLRAMGLRTLADCRRLPRDGLARRIGPSLLGMLDRAFGKIPDPRAPFVPPASYARRLPMPEEAAAVEGLLFAVRRLLHELTGLLAARSAGVGRLTLSLFHREHAPTVISLVLGKPCRDARHLTTLLRERLERVRLPEAAAEVALEAPELVPLAPSTPDLFGRAEEVEQSWQQLIERLSARLGEGAVRGLAVAEEHRPERAWLCRPLPSDVRPSRRSLPRPGRPLWLLHEPRRLETREGRPHLGGILNVQGAGERIETGWWDGRDVARDYFIARNPAGERFWIFRDRRGWHLHGVFA